MPSSGPCRSRFGSWSRALLAAKLEVKKPTISPLCREKMILAHKGKTSFHWKGGRVIDKMGYVHIWDPNHPNAKGGRDKSYVLEHRMVMANSLGRPLLRNEQVHHKNGVRSDNRPENLELWTTSQPSGQRVYEKLAWAKEFISLYENYQILK